RLKLNGPNALPVEKPPSTFRRLLAEYASYMQIILVGAAVVSLFIREWTTAVVLFVITVINAVVGLRQAGKADSAMNALQSMMKVAATGSDTEVGKIATMLSSTATEETPLTKQMNTLTLWIVGAAGITMLIMFALGLSRGQAWSTLFNTAVALAIAAIPLALP